MEKRDLLGEMLIAAIMMITGGEKTEVARMSRADRYLVSRAIIRAAMKCKKEVRSTRSRRTWRMRADGTCNQDATLSAARQARAEEMGQSMMTFTQGCAASSSTARASDWPDADVTLVEMGTLTQDGYTDALAVAYSSLIDSVQSRGENFQARRTARSSSSPTRAT
jgi:hypothetical protein